MPGSCRSQWPCPSLLAALLCPAGRLLLWRKQGCDFPLREGQGRKGSDWGRGGTEWNVMSLCHLVADVPLSHLQSWEAGSFQSCLRDESRPSQALLPATWSSRLREATSRGVTGQPWSCGETLGLGRAGTGLVRKVGKSVAGAEPAGPRVMELGAAPQRLGWQWRGLAGCRGQVTQSPSGPVGGRTHWAAPGGDEGLCHPHV